MRRLTFRPLHILTLLTALLALSCERIAPPSPGGGEGKPEFCDVDLTLDLSEISMDLQTKASTEHITDDSKIESLALFLVEDFGNGIKDQKVVGFRIFLPNGYYYHNVTEEVDENGVRFEDIRGSLMSELYGDVTDFGIGDDRTDPEYDEDGSLIDDPTKSGFQGFVNMSGGQVSKYYERREIGVDESFNITTPIVADGAKIAFHYEAPLHGHTERLRPGHYMIVAIANFHETAVLYNGHHIGYWIKDFIMKFKDAAFETDPDGKFVVGPDGLPKEKEDFAGIGHEEVRPMLAGRANMNDVKPVYQFNTEGDKYDPNGSADPSPSRYDTFEARDAGVGKSYTRMATTHIISTYSAPFDLQASQTRLSLKLERMTSRITFKVQNSSPYDLKINSFSLSDNFAQEATYLFPATLHYIDKLPGDSGPDYSEDNRFMPHWRGAPDVDSPRAIVPFNKSVRYNGNDGVSTFYDALSFESRDLENPMTFSMELEYPEMQGGKATSITYVSEDRFGYNRGTTGRMLDLVLADLNDPTSDHTYLISRDSSGDNEMYIGESETNHTYGHYTRIDARSAVTQNPYTVFQFKPVDVDIAGRTARVMIKNMKTGNYIVAPSTLNTNGQNNLGYTDDATQATIFTISNRHPNNTVNTTSVCIEAPLPDSYTREDDSSDEGSGTGSDTGSEAGSEVDRVMAINWFPPSVGGVSINMTDIAVTNLNTWHFQLTKVVCDMEMSSARRFENQTINVFDKLTGESEILHSLLRNEHLIVQINVKYNPKSHVIEMEVSDWEKKDNSVDFN